VIFEKKRFENGKPLEIFRNSPGLNPQPAHFLFFSFFFLPFSFPCSRPTTAGPIGPFPAQLLGRKSLAPPLVARRRPPCRLSAMPRETTPTPWPKSSSQTRLPPGVLSEAVKGRCSPNHNERRTLFQIQTEVNPVQIWRCSR
jgi:hypothetical protein